MSSTPLPPPGPPPAGLAGAATVRLAVEGMHCDSCTALVEESLGEVAGVDAVSVDLGSGEAVVTFDPAVVAVTALVSVVAEAGYSATLVD